MLLYDDLEGSSDYGVNFSTGSAEIGNDITLATPNSLATEFDLQYYFTTPVDGEIQSVSTTAMKTAEVRFLSEQRPGHQRLSGFPWHSGL